MNFNDYLVRMGELISEGIRAGIKSKPEENPNDITEFASWKDITNKEENENEGRENEESI